jgi:hypothetical protein
LFVQSGQLEVDRPVSVDHLSIPGCESLADERTRGHRRDEKPVGECPLDEAGDPGSQHRRLEPGATGIRRGVEDTPFDQRGVGLWPVAASLRLNRIAWSGAASWSALHRSA